MSKIKELNENKIFKTSKALLKLGILIGILFGIPLYIYFFHKDWIDTMSSLDNVTAFFEANKGKTIVTYLAAQSAQIIICVIPGQWLQIAAGYFFGIPISYLLSLVGALLGSIITYYLAKILGHDAVHLFFGEEKIKTMIHRLNSKKATIIIFLIFLIPGIPKDLCNYAAGLSEMKLKPFLIVSLIGRSPGMIGSIVIGRQIATGSYGAAIAVGVVAVICCILGVIYRERLNKFMDGMYDKYIGEENEETTVKN